MKLILHHQKNLIQFIVSLKNKLEELPNNIEAEQSVIGSILLSNEIFDEVNLILKSIINFFIYKMFY